MTKKVFTIQSEFDGLPLHVSVFEPAVPPKGVLQILHGMCEFKERYEWFMEYFCNAGYVVVCHDHRGHGDSVKTPTDRGYFYDFSGKAIVDDSAQVTKRIKQHYPQLKICLFGHSMGSMIARCFLKKYDDLIDKLIVCGSPSKNPLAGVAICIEKTIRLFRGEKYRSRLLSYLSTGKGNKKFKGEGRGAWLSRNRRSIEDFYAHEKGKYRFTCNGYENLFKMMKRTYQKSGYEVKNASLPIYFVAGSNDPVIGNEKKWRFAIQFLQDVGYTTVFGKLYQGFRHEPFNDIGNEVVLDDLLNFINA